MLKNTLSAHADTKQQLKKAVVEKNTAKLDAKIYKIFKDANSITTRRLRGEKFQAHYR